MMKVKIGRLRLKTKERMLNREIVGFRGYIGRLFREYDIVHNHDLETGEHKYRYPQIQYNVLDGFPIILAIGDEAIEVFALIFTQLNEIALKNHTLVIENRVMEVTEDRFGIAPQFCMYRFMSPWIALNSRNYNEYRQADETRRQAILSKCLIGNLLSMSRSMNYEVDEQICLEHNLQSRMVVMKGGKMLGFTGLFKTNFFIPDFLGIGRSCSFGFGGCLSVMPG